MLKHFFGNKKQKNFPGCFNFDITRDLLVSLKILLLLLAKNISKKTKGFVYKCLTFKVVVSVSKIFFTLLTRHDFTQKFV